MNGIQEVSGSIPLISTSEKVLGVSFQDFLMQAESKENSIIGLVAQLGERSVRIREVEGSNPFKSTKKCREVERFHGFSQLLRKF